MKLNSRPDKDTLKIWAEYFNQANDESVNVFWCISYIMYGIFEIF